MLSQFSGDTPLAKTLDHLSECAALVEAAKQFHARGWMLGTAGNLSARDANNPNTFWITASGLPKGVLEESDFLSLPLTDSDSSNQYSRNGLKPSAETCIHQTIYTLFPQANCCMHVHSIDAVFAINKHAPQGASLRLPAIEMLKGFGIWQQNPEIHLPIFENHLDVADIAKDIHAHYQSTPTQLDALMIRNHGITVWGNSIQQAYNRVELIEFILSYMAKLAPSQH